MIRVRVWNSKLAMSTLLLALQASIDRADGERRTWTVASRVHRISSSRSPSTYVCSLATVFSALLNQLKAALDWVSKR